MKGPGSSKKAKKVAKDAFGPKTVRHDAHRPGEQPHYQHKNGGRGKINYLRSLGTLGVCAFGDNLVGNAVDFFNPAADLYDVVDIGSSLLDYLGGDDGGADPAEEDSEFEEID